MKSIDWERIEMEHRANVLSVSGIASIHGITEGAIRKRAKRDGWERDLNAKVSAKVKNALVRLTVREGQAEDRKRTERETVEETAATVVGLIRDHRKDVKRVRGILENLFDQLGDAILDRNELESTIVDITKDDKDAQRRNRLFRAVSLPVHVGAVKDASIALRNVIGMERQAFGLAESDDPGPPAKTTEVDPASEALEAARARHRKRLGVSDPRNQADSA